MLNEIRISLLEQVLRSGQVPSLEVRWRQSFGPTLTPRFGGSSGIPLADTWQVVAAAELRQQADRWRVAGNLATDAAIGLSAVGLLFYDDLQDYPGVDRGIVIGIACGLGTWAISGLMMRKLRREADLLDGLAVTPEPGGAAVRGSLSW